MKLHWSPRSPYVRKVMVVAHEHGLVGEIECVRSVAATTDPNPAIMADNPLNKIPTLLLADGRALYDSLVIAEYLDGIGPGPTLFPAPPARWDALRRHALASGLTDLLIQLRGERSRPEALRSRVHLDAYRLKIGATLDLVEREGAGPDAPDIGSIALGCALAHLDFRFPALGWRDGRPGLAAWYESFAARPAMAATRIVDDEAAPQAPAA